MLSDMSQTRNITAEEIAEEYSSSLQDLHMNSKPHINMLTLLAEDYIEYASAIVEAVEAHLLKVQSELKLPVLYLIDSIVKNVNGSYLNLFTKNIVHTFCDVFEKVDENTRAKMWKLRLTWNSVFPIKKLFALDVGVHNIDPAWPLSTLPPNMASKSIIHVNPKFLSMQQKVQPSPVTPLKEPEPAAISDEEMREELLKKKKELVELQQHKLQLELMKRENAIKSLKKCHKTERQQIHVNPELIASDGILQKQLANAKPCDVPKILESQSPKLAEARKTSKEQQSKSTSETRAQLVKILQNGTEAPIENVKQIKSASGADSVTRPCEAGVAGNADLSLITNDNKSLDNEPSQRSSTSNQSRDAEPRNSSERSPSKGSSARATAASSSSSSSRKSTRSKSSSSSPHKKSSSSKSRKHSRSPKDHHHHHHHHYHRSHETAKQQHSALDEEEQTGGSLIISPPQPRAARSKRNRDSTSSESAREDNVSGRRDSCSSKDEDLRTPAPGLDTKEDLDLRVLPMTPNKRQSTDILQAPNAKKSKDEFLDDLFGKEDVDLRILSQPPIAKAAAVLQPPTPPPPVISSDKDGWAKFKTPSKTTEARADAAGANRGLADRPNRERPPRPKIYNKPSEAELKDRRRGGVGGREYERNADRNIEIIMKQAAEHLNQGTITKNQYNKLIQEVLHMSEDQKLRAAQRKERESKLWDTRDKGMRLKEHGMHPRPPGGPRWQQPWHQPWAHPPTPFQGHFRPDFRAIGPWQNHPRLFGSPLRPDFQQFHAGFSPRLGPPLGPNGPLILPNGPLNPLTGAPLNPLALGPLRPGFLLGASAPIVGKRPPASDGADSNAVWSSPGSSTYEGGGGDAKATDAEEVSSSSSEELPPADAKVLEEIAKDTMRSINIDNVPREIRYYGHTGVIFMHWDDPRDIGFQNGARRISIDGKDTVVCSFNDDYRDFTHEGEVHRIKLGAPTRELYIDDKWYQCYFGGQPVMVDLGTKKVSIKLEGPPPQVKIGTTKRTDLVVGKINLIINARSMVPVFLDAKPQMFEIEGKSCTLEFIDALQTVLLNGRPFKVEFGGLPKPIIIQGKKHFIRFSVLPRGFRAGYVKITGMKGEQPRDSITDAEQKAQTETTSAVPSPVEPDSTSQDGMDIAYSSKSDLQLDVLSSVVPSAMAPSSGLSYQAEPIENAPGSTPTITLPLNLNELFQRLVETGIVSNLNESKKPEEEEKKAPEIIPVSFDKPETLKIKQPAMVTALYSGIQCSSCGARFAPEMATRYSHHLDWHFRQNRKERDSSRKAHSRLWYYDVSDWIQFEEIEDLEDRAQSWFETEKQTIETEAAASDELFAETLQPSVPTGTDDDSCCQVCREAFEQFYNDEKEEWHFRPAISYEEKNFHPLCLEDHKRAVDENVLELTIATEDRKDNNSIKNKEENLKMESESGDCNISIDISSNIIEVSETINVSEKISIEIIEAIEPKIEETASVDKSTEEISTKHEMSDVEKCEEMIQDSEQTCGNSSETVQEGIEGASEFSEIKQEPIEMEQDYGELERTVQSAGIDSTQIEVKSTIDGNVELESTSSTIPPAQSKIKINLTKTLASSKEPKENKEEKGERKEKSDDEENYVPLKPASIKEALRDRNLSILPPVQKDEELSALCSIM